MDHEVLVGVAHRVADVAEEPEPRLQSPRPRASQ